MNQQDLHRTTRPVAGRHVAVVVSTALMLLAGGSAFAATVRFSPLTTTVDEGTSFTMDLIGTGFGSGSLDGGGIDFTFDPGVLQVVGVVLSPDWEFPVPPATIDNVAGTVTGINFASFADRTGDLTFATVTFDANGPGSSALLLSENASSPFFTGGVAYPDLVFSTQGSVEVTASAVPLPGTLGLLATAAGFVLLRRHRRR